MSILKYKEKLNGMRYIPFNTISDISRIVKYEIHQIYNGDKLLIELLRLLALDIGVAPVCLRNGDIRIYGERDMVKLFTRVYVKSIVGKYNRGNYLISLKRNGFEVSDARIKKYYKKYIRGILDELKSSKTVQSINKKEYLYSLYIYVSRMEKLIPKKWGSKQDESMGNHYVTKRFYEKRILG